MLHFRGWRIPIWREANGCVDFLVAIGCKGEGNEEIIHRFEPPMDLKPLLLRDAMSVGAPRLVSF